jgi:hypothetical protein
MEILIRLSLDIYSKFKDSEEELKRGVESFKCFLNLGLKDLLDTYENY